MRIRPRSPLFWTFLLAAVLVPASSSWSADKKEWVTYPKCRYLESKGNDGDSFLVDCGVDEFFVRLYYVDAPEKDLTFAERTHEQANYFCASLDATLNAGKRAGEFVARMLSQDTFAVQTRRTLAQGRTRLPRYYSAVSIQNRYLHEILLQEGLARNKGFRAALPGGKKQREYVRDLQALEDRAKREGRGLWKGTKPCDPIRPRDSH